MKSILSLSISLSLIYSLVIFHSDEAVRGHCKSFLKKRTSKMVNHPIVRSRAGSIKAPVIRATYSNSILVSSILSGISKF